MEKIIDYPKRDEESLTLVCLHCGLPTEDIFCNEACKREWEERDEQSLRDKVARFLENLEGVNCDLPKIMGAARRQVGFIAQSIAR